MAAYYGILKERVKLLEEMVNEFTHRIQQLNCEVERLLDQANQQQSSGYTGLAKVSRWDAHMMQRALFIMLGEEE